MLAEHYLGENVYDVCDEVMKQVYLAMYRLRSESFVEVSEGDSVIRYCRKAFANFRLDPYDGRSQFPPRGDLVPTNAFWSFDDRHVMDYPIAALGQLGSVPGESLKVR